jgi:predicted RNA binding protein YcfA (HicA-like mRNA interferase family)
MGKRLPRVSGKDMLAALRRAGWYIVDIEGSHHHLRHPDRPGNVTGPVHCNRALDPWVLKKVLGQANMTIDELRELL